MDLLFKEYASPFLLLDSVIPVGQFTAFIETFEKQRNERLEWEFYIHKLPAWDERTWEEFQSDIHKGTMKEQERPTDEQLETTVKTSFEMLQNFKLEGGE